MPASQAPVSTTIGPLRGRAAAGSGAVTAAGTVLSVLPGEHAYEVVFTGEYAGTPVKQDRLLPPLEIVPLTEAETN